MFLEIKKSVYLAVYYSTLLFIVLKNSFSLFQIILYTSYINQLIVKGHE